MRHLFPALALASAVSLFATTPMVSAQNGGDSGSGSSTTPVTGPMGPMGPMPGAGMPGMPPGMGPGMPGMPPGMGASMAAGTSTGTATTAGASTSTTTTSSSSMSAGLGTGGTQFTCALGQVVPFFIPNQGFDQNGRPFFFQTNGWYGPYDGIGYPLVTTTVGVYGGQQMQRTSRGYLPSPCPVAGGGLAGSSLLPPSMPSTATMNSSSLGAYPMGPMGMGMGSMSGMPSMGAPGGMPPMSPMAPTQPATVPTSSLTPPLGALPGYGY